MNVLLEQDECYHEVRALSLSKQLKNSRDLLSLTFFLRCKIYLPGFLKHPFCICPFISASLSLHVWVWPRLLNIQQKLQHTNLRAEFIYFIPCLFISRARWGGLQKTKSYKPPFFHISFFRAPPCVACEVLHSRRGVRHFTDQCFWEPHQLAAFKHFAVAFSLVSVLVLWQFWFGFFTFDAPIRTWPTAVHHHPIDPAFDQCWLRASS